MTDQPVKRRFPILVATRLTRTQRALVEAAARAQGITLTELIREALLPVAKQALEESMNSLDSGGSVAGAGSLRR